MKTSENGCGYTSETKLHQVLQLHLWEINKYDTSAVCFVVCFWRELLCLLLLQGNVFKGCICTYSGYIAFTSEGHFEHSRCVARSSGWICPHLSEQWEAIFSLLSSHCFSCIKSWHVIQHLLRFRKCHRYVHGTDHAKCNGNNYHKGGLVGVKLPFLRSSGVQSRQSGRQEEFPSLPPPLRGLFPGQ